MKISKLHINSFRHLENLEFDFTYPLDYKDKRKAGKPLDKICFIGQSATGKTGLLELIENQYSVFQDLIISSSNFSSKDLQSIIIDAEISFLVDNDNITFGDKQLAFKGNLYQFAHTGNFGNLLSEAEKKNLIFLKSSLISDKNLDLFTKNPIELFEKYPRLDKRYKVENLYSKGESISFDEDVDIDLWLGLLFEILEYRKKFNQKMSELIHKGLLGDTNKLTLEFQKWQTDNPNKIDEFAKKFNPILLKLNLEVDIVNTEYTLPIKIKNGESIIPIQNTSTGTKGLLLSFLPLYTLDTKGSIVLIDEPERSLYPDMQMDIMEHYQNLAPEAQFIVATHSPFIAASFEPEERFILYFDDEGKVKVKTGKSPIGDDPNDILKNDFGLEFLMNQKGLAAFEKFRNLKKQIALEQDENKKDYILAEILDLANAYKF